MKRNALLILFLAVLSAGSLAQKNASIRIDANKVICHVTQMLNGTNIEDVNNQTNGGMFSQLLHGEAFEEGIDPDFLNLDRKDYSKVYVVLDERRIPHLLNQANVYFRIGWNNLGDKYDVNSYDVYQAEPYDKPVILSGWRFGGRFLPFDSIPENIQKIMLERINGRDQVSKYWSGRLRGNPDYRFELVRDGKAYMGRQTQRITYSSGKAGERVGITNHGLYRMGIEFEKGKDYVGVLRVRSDKPQTIYVSLGDSTGRIFTEKPVQLKGNGEYEKVEFSLVSSEHTSNGAFGIWLDKPGQIDLGFAFLQPGLWGRIDGGWPIRTRFIDALKRQGIRAFRYNGSMVDVGADTYLYRWKKMRGPVDERRITFRSGFNPYATHSFGFFEMLQAAESLGATAIIGMSKNETAEDIHDFVEYVNSDVSTPWGKKRMQDGHPAPYNLKYIQVDNEHVISRGYVECVKKFAQAAWKADSTMNIMTSLNLGRTGYRRGSKEYELASELAGWFISQGKGSHLAWDTHYSGERNFADCGDGFLNEMGITLQEELAKDYPGFKLSLTPMEENGDRCDWDRGLAHAHNWNTLQRYGDHFTMLGTANTFQPHGYHYMWDQGRIHFLSDRIWFQPSALVDEMMMKTWKPVVVDSQSSDSLLDVTAKVSEDGKSMTIYVVNLNDKEIRSSLEIRNFKYRSAADVEMLGGCDLTEFNGPDTQDNVSFRHSDIKIGKNAVMSFPRYSYSVITLRQ